MCILCDFVMFRMWVWCINVCVRAAVCVGVSVCLYNCMYTYVISLDV